MNITCNIQVQIQFSVATIDACADNTLINLATAVYDGLLSESIPLAACDITEQLIICVYAKCHLGICCALMMRLAELFCYMGSSYIYQLQYAKPWLYSNTVQPVIQKGANFHFVARQNNLVKINSYESSRTSIHVCCSRCLVQLSHFKMSLYCFFKPVNKKLLDPNGELSVTILPAAFREAKREVVEVTERGEEEAI